MGLNTQQTITQSNNLIQLNSHNLEYHNGNYHYTWRYHPMWYFANLLYHLSIEIPYHKIIIIIIIIIVGGTNLFPIRYCPLWEWPKGRYHPHGFVQSHIGESRLPPLLRLDTYKARVEGVSPRCGIEQIHEGGIGPWPISKADNTWLEKDSSLPQ